MQKRRFCIVYDSRKNYGPVVELVDTPGLELGAVRHGGSTPSGTTKLWAEVSVTCVSARTLILDQRDAARVQFP